MATPACAICLDAPTHPTQLDGCFHTFCFVCAIQWAKVNQTCPICKSSFVSLIHSYNPTTKQFKRLFITPETLQQYDGTKLPTSPIDPATAKRKEVYVQNLTPFVSFQPQPLPFPIRDGEKETPILRGKRQAIYDKLNSWVPRELTILLHPDVLDERAVDEELKEEIEIIAHKLKWWLENIADINSNYLREELKGFLFENTEKFLSEFFLFLSSPYTMAQFDSNVEYRSYVEID